MSDEDIGSTHKIKEENKEYLVDEYGFNFEASMLPEYQAFINKHLKRKALIVTHFREQKINSSMGRKKLKALVHSGVPQEQRSMLWLISSGAYKKKESANSNCENGSYYNELVEKNKKSIEKGKPLESFYEVEKDITRTFPGHAVYESPEGLEKLKRVLQAYARRNKQVGYCQSMNFIAAFALLFMDEEDAFWLLATAVEDLVPGTWSRTMMNIQVDSLVLGELVKEKLPEIHKHFEKIHMSLLLIATKWYMCLFIGNLPSEAVLRLWDHLFVFGAPFMFKISLSIFLELQDELMRAKDPMQTCRVLQTKTRTLFDAKPLIKLTHKWSDITKERVEELRVKHQAALTNSDLSQEQIQQLREQVKQGWTQGAVASEIFSSLSSTYKNFSGKFDSWYRSKKDNYNNYLQRQKVNDAKARNASVFEIDPDTQKQLFQFAESARQPIDMVVSGIGVRHYSNGKRYQGNFQNNKREGYGLLFDAEGKIEYDGFWRSDKREGAGYAIMADGSLYKGDWKADEYHGRGSLKATEFEYDGEWKYGKQEGKGVISMNTGERYEGDWKSNQPEGKGIMTFANGDKYEGDWKASNQEGKGVMVFANGDRYEGSWKNNRQEGRGYMAYASGDKYEGDWKKDKRDGKGISLGADGERYEGEWKADKREGHGKATYPDGGVYEGDWKNNKQNGRGSMIYPSGMRYEGDWSNNKRHGKGKLVFANGDSYEGDWRNDVMEGNGVYITAPTAPGGQPVRFEGEFDDGYRIIDEIRYLPNGDNYDPPEGETRDRKKKSAKQASGNSATSSPDITSSPSITNTTNSTSFSSSLGKSSNSEATTTTSSSSSSTSSTTPVRAAVTGGLRIMQNRSLSSAIEDIKRKNLNK